jgi:DNA-binding protein Fis
MKYVENIYNVAIQRAFNTVAHFQQQAMVTEVQKELEEFIKSHKTQDIAVWILAVQNTNQQMLSKVMELQEAKIVNE